MYEIPSRTPEILVDMMTDDRRAMWLMKSKEKEKKLSPGSLSGIETILLHKSTIPRIQTSKATSSSENFIQDYDMFRQTGEIIKWDAQIKFLRLDIIASWIFNFCFSDHAAKMENGGTPNHFAWFRCCNRPPRQLLARLGAWNTAADLNWVNESKYAWQRLIVIVYRRAGRIRDTEKSYIRTLNTPSQGLKRLCYCVSPGRVNWVWLAGYD